MLEPACEAAELANCGGAYGGDRVGEGVEEIGDGGVAHMGACCGQEGASDPRILVVQRGAEEVESGRPPESKPFQNGPAADRRMGVVERSLDERFAGPSRETTGTKQGEDPFCFPARLIGSCQGLERCGLLGLERESHEEE